MIVPRLNHLFCFRINDEESSIERHYKFCTFIMPAVTAGLTAVLLSPILLRRQSIAQTLYCDGTLTFFGDPFPESIGKVGFLKRTPKPSKVWSYENLLFRNVMSRILSLTQPQFWKLFWERWICRGVHFNFSGPVPSKKTVIDYVLILFWLPISCLLLFFHVLPVFSFWENYVSNIAADAWCCTTKCWKHLIRAFLFLIQMAGIIMWNILAWHLLLFVGQCVIFLTLDMLRHAQDSIPKIIIVCAIVIYIRKAFDNFEDGYREFKGMVFNLCVSVSKGCDEGTMVVVKHFPYEPLYLQTTDGEASIPRRIFYEICRVYKSYTKEVAFTSLKLLLSFALMIVVYVIIIRFQIFDQLSTAGEALITLGTVTLPAVLGVLRSSSQETLSHQRRKSYLTIWLKNITVSREVHVDLDKPTRRMVRSSK